MKSGKILKCVIALWVLVMTGCSETPEGDYPAPCANYLDTVDYYLKHATAFTSNALLDINNELDALEDVPVPERFSSLAKIGRQLEQIDIDSAMAVYRSAEQLARSVGDERYTNKFRYRKGSVLAMMGLVREGIEIYISIPPESVYHCDKLDYFATGHHIFDAAVDYYRVDSLKQKYRNLSIIYNDSTLAYARPGSMREKFYRAIPKLRRADREAGISELKAVMKELDIDDPFFAKAAAEVASAYLASNDIAKAKYFFALSAIGDLKAGTRETTSLHRLGKILNNEEDYQRAYEYLNYSLEAAVNSGSNLRTIEIGEIMPAVTKASRNIEMKHQKTLVFAIMMLSSALVILICLIGYVFYTRHKLRLTRKKIAEISDSKDMYIRKLLSLCGAYLSALENFNKLAGRKIKVGQINDLLSMIESGKVIREQLQSFYEVFDEAFLAVYPNFVEEVNSLLEPDKQITSVEAGNLGMELRIVAFMRLGVDDSAQIARFLGLSLNTIYTYRNKVKTRAKNRATFEQDVRNIGRHIVD